MRKTVLTILGVSLMVVSTVQIAAAAGSYQRSRSVRVPTSQPSRNSNDFLAWPSVEQRNWSDCTEGHVVSAPAGH
jgi:hypothetical protein